MASVNPVNRRGTPETTNLDALAVSQHQATAEPPLAQSQQQQQVEGTPRPSVDYPPHRELGSVLYSSSVRMEENPRVENVDPREWSVALVNRAVTSPSRTIRQCLVEVAAVVGVIVGTLSAIFQLLAYFRSNRSEGGRG
ncbi:hypothetical protein FRC00_007419 [Tulasnella sp. 408]|nr:hypothetical protein FRC00_007419 [Tulasnella sp. 408]